MHAWSMFYSSGEIHVTVLLNLRAAVFGGFKKKCSLPLIGEYSYSNKKFALKAKPFRHCNRRSFACRPSVERIFRY